MVKLKLAKGLANGCPTKRSLPEQSFLYNFPRASSFSANPSGLVPETSKPSKLSELLASASLFCISLLPSCHWSCYP